ncbi:MAG: VCBS repeat-containing protein [Anditalea sp.]
MMRCFIFYMILFTLLAFSCGKGPREQQKTIEKITDGAEIPSLHEISGAQLAKSYCSDCHLFPEPAQLDKNTWKRYILPRMGHFFGIYATDTTRESLIEGGRAGQFVEKMNIFPVNPTIDTAIYNKIKRYYMDEAPEKIPMPPSRHITKGLKNFSVKKPPYKSKNPMTSFVKISEQNGIYISDVGSSTLSIMDKNLKVVESARTREGTVWIHEDENASYALVVGTFNPTDMNIGYLMKLPSTSGDQPRILMQNLHRPVHVDFGDLDGDGLEDIVICEYGRNIGSLSWWKQDRSGNYRKNMMRNKPGATKAYIRDLDKNGKPDIIALFGQGDEGIFIYHNQGNGRFIEENVLRFPASYGSSYFNLFDFNKDGHEDIIFTAGDNADYDPILKDYHGIRIFLNDGTNQFTEEFFCQLNGAYKAIPMDFDQDGDIDIAAISFFPDYENSPEEGFIYLENKGEMNFEASTFGGSAEGRWIAMDAGDMDDDGDMDIILGSMIFGTDYTMYFDKWLEKGLPFIILENNTK